LLQDVTYIITLEGSHLPKGAQISLQPVTGHFYTLLSANNAQTWFGQFFPGSYTVQVEGLAPGTPYQIKFRLTGGADNPEALVSGPAPALQFHFDVIAPPGTSAVASATSGNDGQSGDTPGAPGGSSFSSSGGGGTTTPPSAPGGPSSSSSGGGTSTPPSAPGGSSSPGGGGSFGSSGTPAPAGGSGVTGVISGPAPFSSTGSSGTTDTTTAGNNAQPPLLVTLNVPAESTDVVPSGSGSGLAGGTTSAVPGAALVSITTAAVGAGALVVNLVSANLALLGVGPVGGVSQTGSTVAGIQTVQVALPTPGNSPIPMALVSMITLTRAGELGDLPPPAGPDGALLEAADALVETRALIPAPALGRPEPNRAGADAPEKLVELGARPLVGLATADIPAAGEAAAPAKIVPLTMAAAETIGRGEPAAEGSSATPIDALATANGPWLLLITALGTVAFCVRRRRMARRAAAARQFDATRRPAQGLFRLWGLRSPARSGLPHERRSVNSTGPATARSNPAPRPRHLSNP
jgi:hypothetical protein